MTGARPKIPLHIGVDQAAVAAKMKRSPKFSSFDSQASLAEFSSASASTSLPNAADPAATFTNQTATNAQFPPNDATHFQRSFSTYEMGAGGRRSVASSKHFELAPPRSPKMSPECTSALPDFVQDHILMDGLYSGGGGGSTTAPLSSISSSSMQLPDFTMNGNSNGGSEVGSIPFDLMCTSSDDMLRRNPLILPLDLPPSNEQQQRSPRITSMNNIPLDLTARSSDYFLDRQQQQDLRSKRYHL